MTTIATIQYRVSSFLDQVSEIDPVGNPVTRTVSVELAPVSASGSIDVEGTIRLSKKFPVAGTAPAIKVGDPLTVTISI